MSEPLPGMPLPADRPDLTKMSAQQRRTWRQVQVLKGGLHPLSLVFDDLPLHTLAAPADNRHAAGRRCGTCAFFRLGAFNKCTFGDGIRITHGAGTDLRKWWPACINHEAAHD